MITRHNVFVFKLILIILYITADLIGKDWTR